MEIIVSGIGKRYRRRANWALQDASFSLGTGVTALLGPNGAGKTTLLNILATLLTPTQGQARVGGYDTQRQRQEVRRLIGFLPQDFGLYDGLTASEFLEYMGLLKDIDDYRLNARQALERVGLESVERRRVGTFSGGMRQRLGIAQALLNTPPVLIVDEPTAGLDPAERIRFRHLLRQLALERVVLLSTHLTEDVSLTAERVILLHLGQVRFNGTVEALVQTAQRRVWAAHIARQDLERFQSVHTVTHFAPEGEQLLVRFLAEDPPQIQAETVTPTLEEAYLRLVKGRT